MLHINWNLWTTRPTLYRQNCISCHGPRKKKVIAATKDEKFRAFNKRTGKPLVRDRSATSGFAATATYEVNGKQYIVITRGGDKLGTKSGDSYVAFALANAKK